MKASRTDIQPRCKIDRNVMNADTVANMTNIGLSFFADLCGRNRGAFVLDPPDGETYGCISFPSNFGELAGVLPSSNVTNSSGVAIKDSNSIISLYEKKEISAADVVDLLDFYVKSVYGSSSDVDQDPYACNVNGLATLECNGTSLNRSLFPDGGPIRSVTLAGLFVPAPWATGGKTLTLRESKTFYTKRDFREMKSLGLNAVQIPVPASTFAEHTGIDYDDTTPLKSALTHLLSSVSAEKLYAILVIIDQTENHATVSNAAMYASNHIAVMGLTLPSGTPTLVAAARAAAPTLPLFLPVNESELRHLNADGSLDRNTYASVDMAHSATVADVASSSSPQDRSKMFYHEAISCNARAPVEYTECYRDVPVFVSGGFDLSIDDCIYKDTEGFRDFGQCGRLGERLNSDWWSQHRQSLARRMLFSFERGIGWSYATWKLYDEDKGNLGVLDRPAKLLALKEVVAAGLMPNLTDSHHNACLNPPVENSALGDDTAAPTPGPVPDCGNGWWNYINSTCDYWVPPPPVTAPMMGSSFASCPAEFNFRKTVGVSGLCGASIGLLIGAILHRSRGTRGYTTLR